MTGLSALTRRGILRLASAAGFLLSGLRDGSGKSALSACDAYPEIDRLDCHLFALRDGRMSEAARRNALQAMQQYLIRQKQSFLGFQANQALSYASDLSFLLDMHANNIGDPFENSNMPPHQKPRG